jgi:hypothetical protein
MSSRLHNWGGNFQLSTQNIQYPRTTADVQKVVRGARKLRVMGSRHSFNHIADSCDTILSTLGMNTIVRYNASVPSVTVQPGITYSDLGPALCLFLFLVYLGSPLLKKNVKPKNPSNFAKSSENKKYFSFFFHVCLLQSPTDIHWRMLPQLPNSLWAAPSRRMGA